MSAPPPSRPTSFLQSQTLRIPSSPIPIPARRAAANPPPRSPHREHPSLDLVFEMSPVASDDTSVEGLRTHCPTMLGDAYHRKPYAPFSHLVACSGSPIDATGPYAHEPFLYSIPKLPSRLSLVHRRSQSELVSPSTLFIDIETPKKNTNFCVSGAPSSAASRQPSSNSLALAGNAEECTLYGMTATLTEAFQNSVSSGTSFTTSTFPPSPVDSEGTSILEKPTVDQNSFMRPVQPTPTRRREDLVKGVYPTGISRTSAAAPVLSFAQVELGVIGTRVGKGNPKPPPCSSLASRARSPYPLLRGRRNSILRERSMRFSDDDINGTLKHDRSYEKFGLEKYLPVGMQKRGTKDENGVLEQERGRTRSRARIGLRP